MRRIGWLIALCIVNGAAAGCVSHDFYLISRAQLASADPAESRGIRPGQTVDAVPVELPALREDDGRRVLVKVSALDFRTATPVSEDAMRVQARGPSRLITAGWVLTFIGTAVSLTGTALFAVGKVQDNNPIFYAGAFSAIAAEPIMWTGTGLWIAGALRRPYDRPELSVP
jgi:hypothetical protein